jgi:carbamoyl-phosphate synthase large subunit
LRRTVAARPDTVIQEGVGSPRGEYTAGVLYFDGQEPISVVMRRDLRDGNTYRAYVDSYPELNTFVRRVAVALRPYGPVNFQFRVDDVTPKIFEINGRFSGTTPMRARAGFNEVEMAIRHLVNGAALTQPHVEHVTFLRYWDEIMVRPGELPDHNQVFD